MRDGAIPGTSCVTVAGHSTRSDWSAYLMPERGLMESGEGCERVYLGPRYTSIPSLRNPVPGKAKCNNVDCIMITQVTKNTWPTYHTRPGLSGRCWPLVDGTAVEGSTPSIRHRGLSHPQVWDHDATVYRPGNVADYKAVSNSQSTADLFPIRRRVAWV